MMPGTDTALTIARAGGSAFDRAWRYRFKTKVTLSVLYVAVNAAFWFTDLSVLYKIGDSVSGLLILAMAWYIHLVHAQLSAAEARYSAAMIALGITEETDEEPDDVDV